MMWKWTALFLTLVLGGNVCGFSMHKDELSDRMDGIQQDIEILGNELEAKMDLILKHLEIESASADLRPALQLLNGTRKVISEEPFEVELTVYFRNVGHDDDVTVRWLEWEGFERSTLQGAKTRSVPGEGGSTLWTTSVNYTLKDSLILRIERLDLMLRYQIEFAVKDDYGDDAIQRETTWTPGVTFQLLNGPDFVYSDDEIVTLKIQTSGKDKAKYDTDLVSVDVETIPEGSNVSETITCNSEYDKFCDVAIDSVMKFRDHMTYDIKIHTGLVGASRLTGFTTLKMLRREKNAHVQEFEMQQKVVIKPRGQRGPYPDGFGTVSSRKGIVCNIDAICLITCTAHGDQLKEIKAFDKATLEEKKPIYSYSTNLGDSSYIMETQFEVVPPAELNLAPQNNVFICMATTKDGETAETPLAVQFGKLVKILTNESYAEINGRTLTAQCVATGYPLPDLDIQVYSYYGNRMYIVASKERNEQNLTVKAVGTADNLHHRLAHTVSCEAFNPSTYDFATLAEKLTIDSSAP